MRSLERWLPPSADPETVEVCGDVLLELVEHQKVLDRALEEARETADRLASASLRIPAKVGEEGRIFGSITVADIAEVLQRSTGIAVDRKRIHLPEPIRSVGRHEIAVHLHQDVNVVVTVEVVPQ